MNAPPVGSRWQHTNSGVLVDIIANAKIEDTLVDVVVYRHADEPDTQTWVRPRSEWEELVVVRSLHFAITSRVRKPRFVRVGL
jgi:hypothetical protein